MIARGLLFDLYVGKQYSAAEIARRLACSEHAVNYWIKKYSIQKRSISEAIYLKRNPHGNPFTIRAPQTIEEGILYGLGIGLYWGEGTKADVVSVRIGNSNPELIKTFIRFLVTFYEIDIRRLRFGLQVFGDMDEKAARLYWTRRLGVSEGQFYKTITTPYRGIGNYRKKAEYGVLTLYFSNKKLRDIICHAIEKSAGCNKPM